MSYPDFDEIARRLSIPRCRGIRANGQTCHYDHRHGSIGEGLIHWADRTRIMRAGVRRFLKLAALQLIEDVGGETRPWARLYRAQKVVNTWGADLGITFPGHLTQQDKLAVKAMLIGVATDEPLREEAMDWAQDT